MSKSKSILLIWLVASLTLNIPCQTLAIRLSRRAAVSSALGALPSIASPRFAAAGPPPSIVDRFRATKLAEPRVKQRSEFTSLTSSGLYDDLFYPDWIEGEWDVVQTLMGFEAPLGSKFLSGPSGNRPDIAEATMKQQRERLGTAVGPFPLRFISVSGPGSANGKFVVEDRAFNTASRLNAFAG